MAGKRKAIVEPTHPLAPAGVKKSGRRREEPGAVGDRYTIAVLGLHSSSLILAALQDDEPPCKHQPSPNRWL
jgi:hypothetical protein